LRDSYGNLSGIMASAPSERLVVDLCGLGSALRTYVSERGLNVSEAPYRVIDAQGNVTRERSHQESATFTTTAVCDALAP